MIVNESEGMIRGDLTVEQVKALGYKLTDKDILVESSDGSGIKRESTRRYLSNEEEYNLIKREYARKEELELKKSLIRKRTKIWAKSQFQRYDLQKWEGKDAKNG